jgi:hypothetical protein
MHANRLITTAVVTAALAGFAAPAATAVPADGAMHGTTATRPIPVPPTWPLHPRPIARTVDARPIPVPPTWPLHPRVIPPPSIVTPPPAVAGASTTGFDWGSAGIGAGAMLAMLAMLALAFVAATRLRRRRGALPRTAATE